MTPDCTRSVSIKWSRSTIFYACITRSLLCPHLHWISNTLSVYLRPASSSSIPRHHHTETFCKTEHKQLCGNSLRKNYLRVLTARGAHSFVHIKQEACQTFDLAVTLESDPISDQLTCDLEKWIHWISASIRSPRGQTVAWKWRQRNTLHHKVD